MDETLGKIIFTVGAVLLALVSGAMLFSSILLVGSPELTASTAVLEENGASTYIWYWGFIFLGAVLSLVWIHFLPDLVWLFRAVYFFFIPFPVYANIFSTYENYNWMNPANDALKSWSGISFGVSPWVLIAVLIILHQIWKLGYHLWLSDDNDDGDFDFNPAYYIIRTAFNIAILVVYIPVLNFFGWANRPPMFSERMFFGLNVIIYIVYVLYRKNMTARSPILLSIFNVVSAVLFIILYAFLNSSAFDLLYYHLTSNPLLQLLIPLFIFGGNGIKVGEETKGDVKITYYRLDTMSPGELATNIILAAALLIIVPILYTTDAFSFKTYIAEVRESAQERLANPELAREMSAMETIRRETSFRRGETVDDAALAGNKAALEAYIESGVSYRASGEITNFHRIYYNPWFFKINAEMSYNHENNVYKFVIEEDTRISSSETHQIYNDSRLKDFYIKNGTYYIVSENGNTYILSEIDGEKTVANRTRDTRIYNLLMECTMGNILANLEFLSNPEIDKRFWRDGYFYQYRGSSEELHNITWYEIRTYADKPVFYRFAVKNHETTVERQIDMNFFYNKIPDDNPSAADWK